VEYNGQTYAVTEIGRNAFKECRDLTSVTIPNSVTKIGWISFGYCHALKDVIVSWNTPLPVDENPFSFVTLSMVTLHVPAGTEDLYKVAPVWKEFRVTTSVGNERVEPVATLNAWATDGIVHIAGLRTGEAFVIYNIQGQLVYKGIAYTGEEEIALSGTPGVYILSTGERRIKFLLK
jgi:hypothetical protein